MKELILPPNSYVSGYAGVHQYL